MNAKQMFEKLGFTQDYYVTPVDTPFDPKNAKGRLDYTAKHEKSHLTIVVSFHLCSKRWIITGYYGCCTTGGIRGSVDLFLAIHQQMKELGWLPAPEVT